MKNGQFYILDGHTPVRVDSLHQWAQRFEYSDRHVAHDRIGGVEVSTVFLGLDHNFGDGPPLLFETMIFGGKQDQYQHRYSTWDEALAGHQRAVDLAKSD